ncbi:hypothetical protein PSYPI_37908, partial [Pseudomonas syringae pv. pisi str. 1704B]
MSDYSHVHPASVIHFNESDDVRLITCSNDFWVHHPSAQKIILRMELAMKMRNKINAPSMLVTAP